MKIYLAGPINGCSDEDCRDWRDYAKEALVGHETVDPMRNDYRGKEKGHEKTIVETDKADIDGCDLLLENVPKPSVGTAMEIFYAHSKGKKVIIVVPPGGPVSPWLAYHATHIVDNFAEAFSKIDKNWHAK